MLKNLQIAHIAASEMYGAVDRSIECIDFGEAAQAAKAEGSSLQNAVNVYKSLRPLLVALSTVWMLPPPWRTGLVLLVTTFDSLTSSPVTVDPDFKAGKDL